MVKTFSSAAAQIFLCHCGRLRAIGCFTGTIFGFLKKSGRLTGSVHRLMIDESVKQACTGLLWTVDSHAAEWSVIQSVLANGQRWNAQRCLRHRHTLQNSSSTTNFRFRRESVHRASIRLLMLIRNIAGPVFEFSRLRTHQRQGAARASRTWLGTCYSILT